MTDDKAEYITPDEYKPVADLAQELSGNDPWRALCILVAAAIAIDQATGKPGRKPIKDVLYNVAAGTEGMVIQ